MRFADPLRHVLHEVERQLGPVAGAAHPLEGTAPGHRLLVHVAGVGQVFVKSGDGTPEAAQAVGAEVALLQHLRSPHLPTVLAGDPLDEVPWMVQSALSQEGWPPPWPAKLKPLWKALERLHALPPPPWLPAVADIDPWEGPLPDGLDLHGQGDALRQAARRVSLAGSALVHGDLGGGNLHVEGRRVAVVDWSDAFVGAPEIDVLSIAVDICHDEGRRVDLPVDDPAAWLAKTAGLLASAAARPAWDTPGGPQVRDQQAALAQTAVDWAVDACG